jgi:hypothetical protein
MAFSRGWGPFLWEEEKGYGIGLFRLQLDPYPCSSTAITRSQFHGRGLEYSKAMSAKEKLEEYQGV